MVFVSEENIYRVKTANFEGPLDLLLELIEKNKLQINEVSLARVADDYIAYVKEAKEFPMVMSAHFILVASTLLLIKSKSLLPTLDLTDEEKTSIEELERRLKMLKKARELSKHVASMFGKNIIYFANFRAITPVFSPHKKIKMDNIVLVIKELLKNSPVIKELLPKAIVQKVISLEEMVESLISRVKKSLKLSFREFSGGREKEKIHVIVSFLAVLELVKQGAIHAHQDRQFDEITMENTQVSVPDYS